MKNSSTRMMRIESRSSKLRDSEYLSYVDIEAHEMEKCCAYVKGLGSYPAGGALWG